jgi:hypothetical protein
MTAFFMTTLHLLSNRLSMEQPRRLAYSHFKPFCSNATNQMQVLNFSWPLHHYYNATHNVNSKRDCPVLGRQPDTAFSFCSG